MIRKFLLPILAFAGVAFAVFMVRAGNKPPKVAPPVADPARAPFATYVAGAGLVEAATENIAIGTPVAGIVTRVYVQVGDPLRSGLPHDVVRRLAPLITTGDPDEALDERMTSLQPTTPPSPSIPSPAAATQAKLSSDSTAASQPAPLDLNLAPAEVIAALEGIGPQRASHVVGSRPFKSIWDLEGTPLFKIDDRQARATLAVKKAAADQARQRLVKSLHGTRDEDVKMAEAEVEQARASASMAKRNFTRWSRVEDSAAVPPDELANRQSMMEESAARQKNAEANLGKLQAGTWEPDVQIARADVQAAEAEVYQALTELDRLTVRASIDGTVLQVKVRPGEYAPSGVLETPLMLIGQTEVLHVRVDVDEHDARRVRVNAEAVASIRGDSKHQAKLRFVQIEPYIVPKRSLTGDSSERVDTRVLQIIYAFDPRTLNAYAGQQMDVFIDAGEPPATAEATAAS